MGLAGLPGALEHLPGALERLPVLSLFMIRSDFGPRAG
jgi:hypothetical protein